MVLDNISGEILAIASFPSYNPNSPQRKIKRNRALNDAFEPGSIIKPLAVAKGIDMGIISKNQVINTSPGFINLSGRVISDPKNYKNITVSEIIAKSSQVGASKLALLVGIEGLISGYKEFGLSRPPNIFFPGVKYTHMNLSRVKFLGCPSLCKFFFVKFGCYYFNIRCQCESLLCVVSVSQNEVVVLCLSQILAPR